MTTNKLKKRHRAKWVVKTRQEVSYEIIEAMNLLDPKNPTLGRLPGGRKSNGTRLVILDHSIEALYDDQVRSYFDVNRIPVEYLSLTAGDEHKTLDQVELIAHRLNEIGTYRAGTPPIGIGGGVLQDVVGMAVSLYRRGIPYIRVPTTLLAQIDGGVAAKNGVNHGGFRNRLGTFAPPPRTLIDRTFIASLPPRQVRSGLGEALKLALIKDPFLFGILERHGDRLVAEHLQDTSEESRQVQPGLVVIKQAISGMVEELQDNLWETDLRRIVDYGHTFSPMIEMQALPYLLHGEAVALDCVFSAFLAMNRGLLSPCDLDRVIAVTRGIGLAPSHPMFCDAELLSVALADTVRHRDGHQNLTLMNGIGSATFVNDLTYPEIGKAAAQMFDLLDADERVRTTD
ncbi:sedoheptulose 7-phosphate cyclase [Amycolatopsis sp. NPDC049868]|uniref:sedoheptulose 7-phosphate cyclase n=1 Tax=Amycolatopsis sp. NPDC049868 TaxID=3363934 RepID=UPI0037B8E113